MENLLSCAEHGTVNPEVVRSIPAKTPKPRTPIYMNLSYMDPETRALNYCYQ